VMNVPEAHTTAAAEYTLGLILALARHIPAADAVIRFGINLGVPADHIRAVELEYDQLAGKWWDFYQHRYSGNPEARYLEHHKGPLTISQGKAEVVKALAEGHFGRRILVGDGASDLHARHAVDLFIGFGGVVSRPQVAEESPVFIRPKQLAPILPLATGPAGYRRCLGTPHAPIFELGLRHIASGQVDFREAGRREAFLRAFDPLPF